MAFRRADGQPLQIDQTTGADGRMPELTDLAGATFIVNGRPFNGTGVGYNPLAATGTAAAQRAAAVSPTAAAMSLAPRSR